MSGRVVQVLVHSEQAVQEGDSLVIVEAMKMETEIRSPVSGLVKEVQVQPGMAVETGQLLLVVEGS
jgi:biotin carboxyl carrier protein